jgi:hypothetical protein
MERASDRRWLVLAYFELLVVIALTLTGARAASAYYIAASGSDSNSGTSKSSPWLHAPGMSTCTANCAAYSHVAGDQIIFRGGDTWHFGNSSLSPFAGFSTAAWSWSHSGSATSCNLNAAAGAIVTTTCDYIGVDQTWYTGGSWTRPILNLDNTVTTASPASCSYDYSTVANTVSISGNYVIFDNFEVFGACYNSAAGGSVPTFSVTGAQVRMTDLYYHGFMLGQACTSTTNDCDEYDVFAGVNSYSTYQRYDHNVIDNSDGTDGNSTTHATLLVFNQSLPEADHNVIAHTSDGLKYRFAILIHDNYFHNMMQSQQDQSSGTHANIMEWQGTGASYTLSTYYFNNLTDCPLAPSTIGESVDMYPGGVNSGKFGYIFNNISNCNYNGGIGTNCFQIETDGGNGGPGRTYYFNNTTYYPCIFRTPRGTLATATFQNGHFINFSGCPTSGVSCAISNFSSVTNTDSGNEVWQTTGGACGSMANNWAPTSGTCQTVGAGANLASSICAGMDNSIAAAACTYAYGGVTYNTTNHTAVDNTPVARGSTWDASAYQYTSTGSVTLSPSSQSFGSVNVGSSSSNVTFTLTNGTGTGMTAITVSNVGGNTGDFVNVGTGTCGSTLAASSSCTIIYNFTPAGVGSRSTTLTVGYSGGDGASPQQSALSGTGTPAVATPTSPALQVFSELRP